MLKMETITKIWNANREIEVAKELLVKLEEEKGKHDYDKHAPCIEDSFGRKRHFQLGIPCGNTGHKLLQVSPVLAESVIRAHIEIKKAELAEANEQARIELSTKSAVLKPEVK